MPATVGISFQIETDNFRNGCGPIFVIEFSDPRFPADHRVILHFSDTKHLPINRELYFQSPLVKVEPINALAKYNSLETFDDSECFPIFHTENFHMPLSLHSGV